MEQDIEILEELLNAKITFTISPTDYGWKALEHLIKAIKQDENSLEEEKEALVETVSQLIKENSELKDIIREHTLLISPYYVAQNYIPVSLVEEKLEKEKLPNIIVGGRRNAKTLEYGKRLGRIEICEEILEERK